MAKEYGTSIKEQKQYMGVPYKGITKERAAKIAHTPNASSEDAESSGSGTRRRGASQAGRQMRKAAAGDKGPKQKNR